MKLKLRDRKINGTGEIIGTVAILESENGNLLFEDMVNLTRARSRDALVSEIATRGKITTDRARGLVLKLMANERADLERAGEEAPKVGSEKKADRLVRLVLESGAELFHDQAKEPHITILEVDGGRHIYRLRSSAYRDRLSYISFRALSEVPSSETIRAALNVLAGIGTFDSPQHQLSVRTAWYEDRIYYDLGDGRAVEIGAAGWEISDTPPILFRRFKHQKAQTTPAAGGNLEDILDLLNLPDEHTQLLFITDIVAGLVPGIPRALSVFWGPQGSGKSLALRFKRELQDPTEVPLQGLPRDIGEFVQIGSHNLCVFLDNLTSLPGWLSDGLSRFATGDGFTKRALFTDDDDFFFKPQGVGGISATNLVITAADLLDRALIYPMGSISEGNRAEEKGLLNRFESMRPRLLGAVFDALAGAMSLKPEIHHDKLPRLADYALWGCATAVELGYQASAYWDALKANSILQTAEALDASPVAQAVLAFMENKDNWQGTPSELLGSLREIADDLKIDRTAKAWPKEAGWVTRRLNLVVPNLAQVGLSFTTSHDGKQRVISLRRSDFDVSPVNGVNTPS